AQDDRTRDATYRWLRRVGHSHLAPSRGPDGRQRGTSAHRRGIPASAKSSQGHGRNGARGDRRSGGPSVRSPQPSRERCISARARRGAREKEPWGRGGGGGGGPTPRILEAAFLVRAGARGRFKTEARGQASAVATAGGELTLTGPWPAYNFVGPDPAA